MLRVCVHTPPFLANFPLLLYSPLLCSLVSPLLSPITSSPLPFLPLFSPPLSFPPLPSSPLLSSRPVLSRLQSSPSIRGYPFLPFSSHLWSYLFHCFISAFLVKARALPLLSDYELLSNPILVLPLPPHLAGLYYDFDYVTIPINYFPLSPDHPPNPPFLLAEAAMNHVIVWNYVIDSAEANHIEAINLAVLKPGPKFASPGAFEVFVRSSGYMNNSCVNVFGPMELNKTRAQRVSFFGVWEKVKGRMELYVQGTRSVGPQKRQVVVYLKNLWGE